MKKIALFFASALTCLFVASCSNELEDITQNQVVQSRTVEPRFTGDNLTESQAIALVTKFLQVPNFFYFKDVIGFDPISTLSGSNFSVSYNGESIYVRAIQVGVIGKNGYYGVWGEPVTNADILSLNDDAILYGEPIYEDSDVTRSNPVGRRYYYKTNGYDEGLNCWLAIAWEDCSTFERIIGWL